ncbi:hypothetical protein SEVIR_1G341750v4 [Setaria viridis]|uniref:Uncharacterized protein n=1 Tax=Setaria viridis TaxID=4556 RepID=A0A4U6WI30_SETVI|nr:hypothetical protein SEVIR_1G341750v2 [Setaria viridis]
MLFLSYHQLHQPAAEVTPCKEAAAGGFRISLSSVLSIPMFERRREAAAPAVRAEGKTVHERDASEDIKWSSENKELEEKFEEALLVFVNDRSGDACMPPSRSEGLRADCFVLLWFSS